AHDLMLHSRVVDYAIDDWATLTYERREFFDWGGWLAVRPMDELPYFRVLMRRERQHQRWIEREREHHDAIEEMRVLLRAGREVSNRDFAMRDRTRIDDYRGRKDSALALHYLWRVGEAMVTRRERFERVYALTEAVAPPAALREVDDVEADDVLARKVVAAAGLTRLNGLASVYVYGHKANATELALWRSRWLSDGPLIEVRVEGWRATQVALASDADLLADLEAGRVPAEWAPLETTTDEEATFLSPLDPVSARGRAKPLFGFDYVWEVYKPVEKRTFGYYTMPILWGDRLVGRFDPKLDRATGTLVLNGLWLEDPALARDVAFVDALARGMARFVRFLGGKRVDASLVPQPALRKRLAVVKPGR
ncbi:MAG: crosslink repair DNA glycosylase YcaQ family protein, partial [Chloroflexota bacterium]